MMDSHFSSHPDSLNKFLGKRVIKDTFDKSGTLIASAHTVLDTEQLLIIQSHELELKESDVETVGPYGNINSGKIGVIIDEAVISIRRVFDQARGTNYIDLSEIRKTITPMIRQIIDQPSLIDLLAALQSKNDYMYRHSIAVGVISALFAKWLNFKEADLLQLTTAAVLHDIGMTRIPQHILTKPEKLTIDEFEEMKRHTILGYEMIKNTIGVTYRQSLVAIQHHERLDGTGYPLGLKADQIDMFSRIVAIADVFHSMSTKKVYSDPSPFYDVLRQIVNNAYGEFDPSIIHLLVDKIMQALIGYEVKLSDGTKGKIVLINPHDALHPLVHADKSFIDLSKHPSIQIEHILATAQTIN